MKFAQKACLSKFQYLSAGTKDIFSLYHPTPNQHRNLSYTHNPKRMDYQKHSVILLLQSLQNMECIWPTEANPEQQSALLFTATPLWFCLSQHWESKLSFQLSTPIMAQDTWHWFQKFIYFLFKTWMGKCTQTPLFPHPFLPIRRAVYFFIWPYERLGKLFHQYSDKVAHASLGI